MLPGIHKDREAAINCVPPEDRLYVRELIESLFPLTADSSFEHRDQEYFRLQGRIAAFDRLVIALSFGLPSEEVSGQEVQAFVNEPETRNELLENHLNGGKIERFVDLLLDVIKTARPPDGVDFILALARIADDPRIGDLDEKRADVIGLSLIRRISWVVEEILTILPIEERAEILESLFSKSEGLALPTNQLITCLRQHGFYKEHRALPESERFCGLDELKKFKELWLRKVEKAFEDGSILEANEKGHTFFLLRRLNVNLCRELVAPYLEKDEDLDRIVKFIGIASQESVKGKYAHVSTDVLESLGGSGRLKARVKERLGASPIESTELIAIYQSIITGKKHYLIDASEGEIV